MDKKQMNTEDCFIGNRSKRLDCIDGFDTRPGNFSENGAHVVPGGVSFTVRSRHATKITLALFERGAKKPFGLLPFPKSYKIGDVYSMIVFDLDIREFEYAYLVDGPWELEKGLIFDPTHYLLDPYGKAVVGQSKWGLPSAHGQRLRNRVVSSDFDWELKEALNIPMEDLIIYELHVRGFTKHRSAWDSDEKWERVGGTYQGVIEKIPYLLELGVNCVELMPIFEFDELNGERHFNNNRLLDYWGYNPVSFFAPNTSYSSTLEYNHEGDELKRMIKALHDNGVEVILDVVYNHTMEGNEFGSFVSLKGFDNNIYYMLTPDGKYFNFSGCGNTMNASHPVVQRMIVDSLRHWVIEYRVDGFRFDLASILGRNEDGTPSNNPSLLKRLAFDSILADVKLIAEAWDAGGLYQVGTFPSWKRWSEWNGRYRDDIRRFLKGDSGFAYAASARITGSHDIYAVATRGDDASVNFITCHDGFTLKDLYSYNEKHNEANGWNNTDGENNNYSWNCGVEGHTGDPVILKLRQKMIKNACAVLLASHGTPMLLAGDEFGNTQYGNNNPYCQDNDIAWLNWNLIEDNQETFDFFKGMIALRKKHPAMRGAIGTPMCGVPAVSVHGGTPWYLEDGPETRVIGVMFAGENKNNGEDDVIYIAINAHWETHLMTLPMLPEGWVWEMIVNTAAPHGKDVGESVAQYPLNNDILTIEDRSVVILQGKVAKKY